MIIFHILPNQKKNFANLNLTVMFKSKSLSQFSLTKKPLTKDKLIIFVALNLFE